MVNSFISVRGYRPDHVDTQLSRPSIRNSRFQWRGRTTKPHHWRQCCLMTRCWPASCLVGELCRSSELLGMRRIGADIRMDPTIPIVLGPALCWPPTTCRVDKKESSRPLQKRAGQPGLPQPSSLYETFGDRYYSINSGARDTNCSAAPAPATRRYALRLPAEPDR